MIRWWLASRLEVYVVDVVVPVPRRMDRVQERMLLSFLPFAWIDVGGLELVARN